MHAASVGEGLQARAVLDALRALRPEVQLIATRFSASADRLADTMPVDWSGYAPYDRPDDVARALEATRPDLLVFAKLDVWPELATGAAASGAGVALVAGSVDPGSARLGWPARAVARRGYAVLDRIAAIDPGDARRLARLGADPSRTEVTGDPRVDSVLHVIDCAEQEPPFRLTSDPPRTLVAGSTWPRDEVVLLDALVRVRQQCPDARLVLVPHQPESGSLARLEAAIAGRQLTSARWNGEPATSAVVLVDRIGVLSRLYPLGAIAYVGGGFGRRGVHSVLEPAGWSRPVIIGPRDRGVRDARLLGEAGALVRLPEREAASAMAAQWCRWLDDPAAAHAAGLAAHRALDGDRGAARRSALMLLDLLDQRAQRPKA
jgi:3-deoxy-D-manno-octulosonic-acid transferase